MSRDQAEYDTHLAMVTERSAKREADLRKNLQVCCFFGFCSLNEELILDILGSLGAIRENEWRSRELDVR